MCAFDVNIKMRVKGVIMKEYVCIDIGGTAIKAGVLDENARIIEQLNIPTEAMQGGSYVLARVKKIHCFKKNHRNLYFYYGYG